MFQKDEDYKRAKKGSISNMRLVQCGNKRDRLADARVQCSAYPVDGQNVVRGHSPSLTGGYVSM